MPAPPADFSFAELTRHAEKLQILSSKSCARQWPSLAGAATNKYFETSDQC
jgi:hypothetical protein